jgi:hypothetical protein
MPRESFELWGRIFAIVMLTFGLFKIYYAIRCATKGRGAFFFKPLIFETERDGDPVGFQSVVWGNAAMGAFMVFVAGYLLVNSK